MLRGIGDKESIAAVTAPATLSASYLSSAVDLKGKRNHAFCIQVGSFAFDATNKLTYAIHESDDNSTYAAHSDSGTLVLNNQATQENKVHMLEYKGNKRYVKLDVVEAGTVSVAHAVTALSTELEQMPA